MKKSQLKKLATLIAFIIIIIASYFSKTDKTTLLSPALTITPTIIPTIIITPTNTARQLVKVIRAIDGDTIEIEGKIKIRYIGIDTPELKDSRSGTQCFANEAYLKNKELVEGKSVYIEKDVSETDVYKRLLRYVYLDDLFVNDYLVRNGYAKAATFPPDVKYANQFIEAQKEARLNNQGLWSSCTTK